MESKNILVGGLAVVGVVVGAAAGPVGAVLGGSIGAVLGGLAENLINLIKQQEEQSQQTTRREKSGQDNSNHPSSTGQRQQQTPPREKYRQPVPTPPVQTTPTQKSTKQSLVLVVSASQSDFLESLQAKRRIDISDGETLYEMTKYLWLGSETDFNQSKSKLSQYLVAKGEESEYDIYLVYFELNKADERFKSNVNQLDRYDAFRNLDNLEINITPRLQMEAYENIDVYNR